MNKIIYEAHFSIFGDSFNITELTELIKIEPTKITVRGEKGKYSFYKETSWNYIIESNKLYLEYATKTIFDVFNSKKEIIKRYINENNLKIKLEIIFNIYDSIVPSLYLENYFIEFLNFLKCEVDFDGYIL